MSDVRPVAEEWEPTWLLISAGFDVHRRDPLTRRVPSKIFNWVTGRVSGLRLHDLNCGLKAYRAEVVRGLRLYGELQ